MAVTDAVNIPSLAELILVGVADANTPNLERIALRPTRAVNLTPYFVMLGVPAGGGLVYPIRDQVLWLGNAEVAPPDWILVMTGPGEDGTSTLESGERVLTKHWGRQHTLFNGSVVPFLVGAASVEIGALPTIAPVRQA